jgi:glycoside/pentoside/hexuronide:cation symporter, GPH family
MNLSLLARSRADGVGLAALLAGMVAVTSVCGCGSSSKPGPITGTNSTPSTPVPTNPVYGLDFGPYVGLGQAAGDSIGPAQLTGLLTTLRGYTQWVRTFGMAKGLEAVPAIAHGMGFKTAMGAWSPAEFPNLVAAAAAGTVDIAITGNEMLLTGLQSEQQVLANLRTVKSQVPVGIPVTYVDTWGTILAHPAIMGAEDVVAVNIYPFWDGVPIADALSALQSAYAAVVQAANGKPVIIAETGWPSSGSAVGGAVPSPDNAVAYFAAVEAWARSANVALFYFEAYDEAWKESSGDYPSWGIWYAWGILKADMAPVFQK